jgi:hypothetical protein
MAPQIVDKGTSKREQDMTYAELFIPSARELRQAGHSGDNLEMLKAHNREIVRRKAKPLNWGWCVQMTGCASKITGGILESNIRNGVIVHKFTTWAEYDAEGAR